LAGWTPPRLPLSGGDLITMGLPQGPIVAATLQLVETDWIAAGFPAARETKKLAAQRVEAALRSCQ
jgi:poly(A) polymerase